MIDTQNFPKIQILLKPKKEKYPFPATLSSKDNAVVQNPTENS